MILDEAVLKKILKARSPKKVFMFSMTDVFGKWVSDEWIDTTFAYMALAKQHTFQLLTKRADRMFDYFKSGARQRIRIKAVDIGRKLGLKYEIYEPYETFDFEFPLPNVWLGVSVGNQSATHRIPYLLKSPAAVRFLSCEPLLELIDLRPHLRVYVGCQGCDFQGNHRLGKSEISWVIVGGESGTEARPCHLDWIRSIISQCQTANVPIFVKQLGSNPIDSNNYIIDVASNNFSLKLKDRKGGDISEFPEELRIRQFP